jgi:hypothetical protein
VRGIDPDGKRRAEEGRGESAGELVGVGDGVFEIQVRDEELSTQALAGVPEERPLPPAPRPVNGDRSGRALPRRRDEVLQEDFTG